MNDPIIEEVRQIREAIAARFGYDIGRMIEHGRELQQELASGKHGPPKVFVDFSRKPNKTAQPTPTIDVGVLSDAELVPAAHGVG